MCRALKRMPTGKAHSASSRFVPFSYMITSCHIPKSKEALYQGAIVLCMKGNLPEESRFINLIFFFVNHLITQKCSMDRNISSTGF
jgi:hypothetical protein